MGYTLSLCLVRQTFSDVATKSDESHGRRSCRSAEKDWLFQDCRCAKLEAEVETCNTCAQGRQPFHERALRFQSQASIKDSESTSDEEVQGVGELILCA